MSVEQKQSKNKNHRTLEKCCSYYFHTHWIYGKGLFRRHVSWFEEMMKLFLIIGPEASAEKKDYTYPVFFCLP